MAAHGVDERLFVPGLLRVEMDADVVRGKKRERLVERDVIGRALVLGVREPEVGPDVELDQIGACCDARRERRERVLGLVGRRAAVPDHERRACGAPQVHGRRITTTAQSSESSPPANARQSASTASAVACALLAACSASTASSRSTP